MYEKCPCCGSELIENDICSTCKKDLTWFANIAKRSKTAYTKGYYYAEERNLSMAKRMLERAVLMDKYNVDARNLLGLVLFEMGAIGEALKHWIVSQSIKKEDNLAVDYIKHIQEDAKALEDYKEALVLYNKSLNYLAQNNGDIGVIGLKKAINLMPNFVEARNLLTACYINQKQEEKALEQIKEILKIDAQNVKALLYLKEINLKEGAETKVSTRKSHHKIASNVGESNKPQKMINRGHLLRNAALYFIVGAVCMFAVQADLILPNKIEGLAAERDHTLKLNEELETRFKTETEEHKNKALILEKENKKLKEENGRMQASQNKMIQNERVQAVNNLKSEGKWAEAAETLYNVSVKDLDEENKQQYEAIKEQVFSRGADELYQLGYNAYQNTSYQEAKAYFEKVVLYAPGFRVAGDALYYMGQMEEQGNNKEKAKQYYNTLQTGYEGSNAAYKAKRALEALEVGA